MGAAAVILTEPSLAREMAGAGEARRTGPVAMKALAEATHVARTARGYAMEYIVRVFWVGTSRSSLYAPSPSLRHFCESAYM